MARLGIVLSITLNLILSASASAGFTVSGKQISSMETNFAGDRQVSPQFGIIVQINHDTNSTRDLELTIIDEVFQALLTDQRGEPLLPRDFLTVVFIPEAKLRRFHEGPKRWIFRSLEGQVRQHSDVYVSPTAVFISDLTLEDERRLWAALHQGLGYLFQREFYEAMEGLLKRGIPVPYPHD